jgi:hypothetical protein
MSQPSYEPSSKPSLSSSSRSSPTELDRRDSPPVPDNGSLPAENHIPPQIENTGSASVENKSPPRIADNGVGSAGNQEPNDEPALVEAHQRVGIPGTQESPTIYGWIPEEPSWRDIYSLQETNFPLKDDEIMSMTDDAIVGICRTTRHAVNHDNNVQILKFPRKVIIKFGPGVYEQEAKNQIFAHKIFGDDGLVRVPRVYRFFTAVEDGKDVGYIMMEKVEGVEFATFRTDMTGRILLMRRIKEAILRLHSAPPPEGRAGVPGPVNGGPSRGYYWNKYSSRNAIYNNIEELQDAFNHDLQVLDAPFDDGIDLTGLDLVFCHGDLAPRNIMVSHESVDGKFQFVTWIIDWEFAGFYPECFDHAVLEIQTGSYFQAFLTAYLPGNGYQRNRKGLKWLIENRIHVTE